MIWRKNGCNVTLGVRDGKKILRAAHLRIKGHRVQILYDYQWLDLCRTDLMDDVATFTHEDVTHGIEPIRRYYLTRIHYGVRIDKRSWRVIDSATDG